MLDIKLLYPVSRKEKVRNIEALLKCFLQQMVNAGQSEKHDADYWKENGKVSDTF
jgi:hypothetical protein